MVLYGNEDSRMPGLFRSKEEANELIKDITDELLARKEKICESLTNKTHPGYLGRIICAEETCRYSRRKTQR